MPSGSKRRKAAKKKKEKEESGLHVQTPSQASQEDSGNEHEHEHVNEDDAITPKTPVQTNEGEEKDDGEGEGEGDVGSSDTEAGFTSHAFNQQEKSSTLSSCTENQPLENTDFSLEVVPENGVGKETELEVSSGGAMDDENDPTGNLGPLNDTEEAHQKGTINGDAEIHQSDVEISTDVGLIVLSSHSDGGDDGGVSSSKLVLDENEPIQTLGPFTDVHEHSPKYDTYIDMGSPSHELESSDGDESKLDIASTLAVFDTNESSIQSVGSVETPRSTQSISSHQFPDQASNDAAVLASEDQKESFQGTSEIPLEELSSEVSFLKTESAYPAVSKVSIEAIKPQQEEDGQESSISQEFTKDFRNEDNIQVSNEVVRDNYAILEEELVKLIGNHESTQEAISTVKENSSKQLVVPFLKSKSSNMRDTPVISTSGEASADVVSTVGEAKGDVVSTGAEARGDVVPTDGEASGDKVPTDGEASGDMVPTDGEASGDKMGLTQVQGTSVHAKEISYKEVALHPRNGVNERATLLQSEPRASWLNCCGILELFTGAHS